MKGPVDPSKSGNVPIGNQWGSSDLGSSTDNANMIPPGPPLPADNPWVRNLALLFPNVPLGEIQMYAAKFQANMFQALNNQINHDLKKAREAARRMKEAIEGND